MLNVKLFPNDPARARDNAELLLRAFRGDENAEVTKGGDFWVEGPVEDPIRVGGPKLTGCGAGAYELAIGDTHLGGKFARLISANGQPLFRLRGTRRIIEGFDYRSVGPEPDSFIEIEGRSTPATGRHVFRDFSAVGAKWFVRTLPGYYESGVLVPDENHADNIFIENGITTALDAVFRCENHQAIFTKLTGIDINCNASERHCTLADVVAGGDILADNIKFNHPWSRLFRYHGGPKFNPKSQFLASGVFVDRPDPLLHPNPYFTIYEYKPFDDIERWWEHCTVRVSSGRYNIEPERLKRSKLIVVPDWYERRKIDYSGFDL